MQNKINKKLVDHYNQTQNDLIFKTRKRLFELENNQKMSFVLYRSFIHGNFIIGS